MQVSPPFCTSQLPRMANKRTIRPCRQYVCFAPDSRHSSVDTRERPRHEDGASSTGYLKPVDVAASRPCQDKSRLRLALDAPVLARPIFMPPVPKMRAYRPGNFWSRGHMG